MANSAACYFLKEAFWKLCYTKHLPSLQIVGQARKLLAVNFCIHLHLGFFVPYWTWSQPAVSYIPHTPWLTNTFFNLRISDWVTIFQRKTSFNFKFTLEISCYVYLRVLFTCLKQGSVQPTHFLIKPPYQFCLRNRQSLLSNMLHFLEINLIPEGFCHVHQNTELF